MSPCPFFDLSIPRRRKIGRDLVEDIQRDTAGEFLDILLAIARGSRHIGSTTNDQSALEVFRESAKWYSGSEGDFNRRKTRRKQGEPLPLPEARSFVESESA